MDPLLQGIYKLVANHPHLVIAFVVTSWLLSVLASALPAPEEIWPDKTGARYLTYRTFYKALQTYCGNVGRIFKWVRLSANNKASNGKTEITKP